MESVAIEAAWRRALHRLSPVRTLVGVQPLPDQIPGRPSAESDSLLWQQSLAGDSDAFGELFDRHRERVFGHACRLAATRHDAEDVLAAAFLELWRLRRRVRLVDGSVLPWLLATTTNVGLNAARSRRRYQRLLERLPRVGEQQDIAESALGAEPRVRDAMRSLRSVDAQLLALVALEGYSVGEAAACLALSTEAARARLHRARRHLREQLSQSERLLIEGEGYAG